MASIGMPESPEGSETKLGRSSRGDQSLRYFRRPWGEDRGDRYAGWGTSVYCLAIDGTGTARQQVEVYANGVVLAYDEQHDDDEFGGLTYADLDLEEFSPFEISRQEFFEALAELRPMNRGRGG